MRTKWSYRRQRKPFFRNERQSKKSTFYNDDIITSFTQAVLRDSLKVDVIFARPMSRTEQYVDYNSSFLRACLSSLITARNSGHSTNLGSDSARGFSDAVLGDSFAIERTINNKLTSVFLNKYLFNQILYIANRSFNV